NVINRKMQAPSAVSALLAFVIFAVLAAQTTKADNCTEKLVADIYILLDGSSSINSVGWGRCKTFVSNLIKEFPVGPFNVQFAIGTFSTEFKHLADLNKFYDKDQLSQFILNTTQLQGVTYTFDALRAIREQGYLSLPSKGSRPGETRILVVLTDGNSDNITKTIQESDALRREQGIRIIVISVGLVNQVECIGIAGSEKNVFSVTAFGGLEAIRSQITLRVCYEPEPEPEPCPSNVQIDLIYIIDSSGSIGLENYKKNFQFVVRSIRAFTLGPQATRVGVITFGTSPRVLFALTDDDVLIYEKLVNATYQNSTTNTHLALLKAVELFSVENGGREGAKKAAIVVSDGLSTDPGETLKAASVMRGLQIAVFTLGVGSQADEDELVAVATKPENAFTVANYSALISLAIPVSSSVCTEPIPPPTVKPCPPATIVDIFFVVDSSGSIPVEHYQNNFKFIQAIVDAYYVAEDGAKVAMLTYGTSVRPKFKLSADPVFIRSQLQNVTYQGSTTNTHLAIAYIVDNAWNSPANGARNKSHVIILFSSDSLPSSTNRTETLNQANRVKQLGFIIIVVAVGPYVDRNETTAVASKPDYVISVNDYTVLDYIASKTSEIACNNEPK
ncbi:unnamed protein product, partial [Candidula unifasciata]